MKGYRQYCGRCSLLWGNIIDTVKTVEGYHQYCKRYSVLWGLFMGEYHQYLKDVSELWGYLRYCWGKPYVVWGDSISTFRKYYMHCGGIPSVLWKIFTTVGDVWHYGRYSILQLVFSTVEVIPKVFLASPTILHSNLIIHAMYWWFPSLQRPLCCTNVPGVFKFARVTKYLSNRLWYSFHFLLVAHRFRIWPREHTKWLFAQLEFPAESLSCSERG